MCWTSKSLALDVRIRPQTLTGNGLFIYSELAGTSSVSLCGLMLGGVQFFICLDLFIDLF